MLEIYQTVLSYTYILHTLWVFLYILCESFPYQTDRIVSTVHLRERKHPADFIRNAEQDNQLTRM